VLVCGDHGEGSRGGIAGAALVIVSEEKRRWDVEDEKSRVGLRM
jgi:hypothetical protein